jgi:serine/threonine protein kinase
VNDTGGGDDDDDELLRALAHAPDMTPPATERDARIGTTIRDKYTLDRVLGEGGMAIVYEGTHRNHKRFAIKVLREKFSDSEVRARFVREGYVANSVEHPGAVTILDDDVAEDGSPYLVMELLDGEPLDRLAAKGPIPVRAAVAIAVRVLEVLDAAHAKGIVHRDIKPQNVFVTRAGDVKVLDFGIARMRAPSPFAAVDTTQAGAMLGTPAFMAPEQALGRTKEIDAQSDLWAVGATMFLLLSGRFVHRGESAQEVAVLAATQRAPTLASVASGVPMDVARIVDRALAFDKANRWPDAGAMREALVAAFTKRFDAEPSRADVVEAFEPAPAPTRSARRWPAARLLLGGGVAVACAAAVVVWASKDQARGGAAGAVSAGDVARAPSASPSAVLASPPPPATSFPLSVAAVVPSARSDAPAVRHSPLLHHKNCNPPFTVDDGGKRIPKPECL